MAYPSLCFQKDIWEALHGCDEVEQDISQAINVRQ